MKYLIRVIALLLPFIIGYWRYDTQSDSPALRDFIGWAIVGGPFSIGLWTSTTNIGKKFKLLTSILIIPSALIHATILSHFNDYLPIIILIVEIYAITSLFLKKEDNEVAKSSQEASTR